MSAMTNETAAETAGPWYHCTAGCSELTGETWGPRIMERDGHRCPHCGGQVEVEG